MSSKIITYVTSRVPLEDELFICSKILNELPEVDLKSLKHLQELFTLLSDPQYHTDYIVFDIDDINGVASYDVIKALSTVIDCTVYRHRKNSKPVKRTTKIIAMVSADTPYNVFKELYSMTEIDNFTLRYGPKVNYEMIKECVVNYLNDGIRPPKVVIDLLKPKKVEKKATGSIQLTSRQQQVFDIVTTRGASNKHIARMLDISESTVKLHVGAILKKYGLKNRTQLAVFHKK
jgi:DNA-binding NarL/FixJ family response regulator